MQPVNLCALGFEKLKITVLELLMRISYSSRFWLQITSARHYLRVHSGKFSLFELILVLLKRGFGP